jgi:hypothetical protein
MSVAMARLENVEWSGTVGGEDDWPYPRRSGQTTVNVSARSGATRHQVVWVRGWPCNSTTAGPDPACLTRNVTSPMSTWERVNPSNT